MNSILQLNTSTNCEGPKRINPRQMPELSILNGGLEPANRIGGRMAEVLRTFVSNIKKTCENVNDNRFCPLLYWRLIIVLNFNYRLDMYLFYVYLTQKQKNCVHNDVMPL